MANERILIVEDEATVAEVVGRYLERDGYKVRHIADGARVAEYADQGGLRYDFAQQFEPLRHELGERRAPGR